MYVCMHACMQQHSLEQEEENKTNMRRQQQPQQL